MVIITLVKLRSSTCTHTRLFLPTPTVVLLLIQTRAGPTLVSKFLATKKKKKKNMRKDPPPFEQEPEPEPELGLGLGLELELQRSRG